MPLKCYYVPRRTKSRLGRRTHLRGSRILASSPTLFSYLTERSFYFFNKPFSI